MALYAKRRLACAEGFTEAFGEDSRPSLNPLLQSTEEEAFEGPTRTRKGRRKQRRSAFGSISMGGVVEACDDGGLMSLAVAAFCMPSCPPDCKAFCSV